jgi:hypothetical protein
VDPARARALTHGFHSYAGRLHPSIARGALERWSARGDRVLDPFCGSGTVLVEAMSLGRSALGLDASPLAVLLAGVRTTPLGAAGRQRLVEKAQAIGEESAERARKRRRPEIPSWAKREGQRFSPHVALELYGLRELVMATPDDEVGRALRMVFSSNLVKFMRAGPEAPRDGETKRIARGLPSDFLFRRAGELARGLDALEKATPPGTTVVVKQGDARGYPQVSPSSIALVLSSPPYAGTYDYAEQHEVRFTWLGLPHRKFEAAQLGAREQGLGAARKEWQEGRRAWLGEMARVLKRGGHAVLVAGDGIVGDHFESAAEAIGDEGERAGLVPVARASQGRPIRDRRLQEIMGGRQRQEHILLLRRR